jgi:hypothetical protein
VLQELQKFVQECWQRVFQRPTVTGNAWFHAPQLTMPEMGGSALLSPSLPFPAGSDLQNQPKTQHRQLILVVLFFRSVSSGRFFSTLDL